MSWKKHFRVVPTQVAPVDDNHGVGQAAHGTSANFSSYLPEIYSGHPNRIQRYYQYEDMDRDSDINAALDTIADFCTQSEEQNDEPFLINYFEEANDTEVKLLKETLNRWVKLNDFKSRLWRIFRNTIKNGDAFFLRDPETGLWLWFDHYTVDMVKMGDHNGKVPDEYLIRNLDISMKGKFASAPADLSQYRTPFGTSQANGVNQMSQSNGTGIFQMSGADRDARSMRDASGQNETSVVDAKHVVHLSLSEGMDVNWPFGASILEPVYKTYKQKELLEDAVIIYRVQRAPERRIFKIDVGTMSPPRARAAIEAIKNEIHQRRIPNRSGSGSSMMDAAYNPLSIMEDYFFAQTSEGRGSSVETLPGGDSLGEIGDLSYFNQKLSRGFRIPPSYLSFGDDANVSYNDGKLGAAMIQEFRFNKYCMRLQSLLAPTFDSEFKNFLRQRGIEIDSSLFELRFNPPQNFTKYRQMEIDAQQIAVYSQVADNKKLAERFKLKRFLNLTPDEIIENERDWREENPTKIKKATGSTPAESEPSGDLSTIGVRPPVDDFGFADDFGEGGGDEDLGGDAAPDMGGDAPPAGDAPAAPAAPTPPPGI